MNAQAHRPRSHGISCLSPCMPITRGCEKHPSEDGLEDGYDGIHLHAHEPAAECLIQGHSLQPPTSWTRSMTSMFLTRTRPSRIPQPPKCSCNTSTLSSGRSGLMPSMTTGAKHWEDWQYVIIPMLHAVSRRWGHLN